MIPNLDPISVSGVAFAWLALTVIAVAWWCERRWFLPAFGVASAIMVASWLSPPDLAALAFFVIPPYFVIRTIWGRERYAGGRIPALVVAWNVLLFLYLRKYEWAGSFEWLDHPLSIIGLSYILFRVIHLAIEAPYLRHLPFGPAYYGCYLLAFWTLISGPIQRYEAFIQGLETSGRPDTDIALSAGHRAVNGLIKAFLIAPIFLSASEIGALGQAEAGWLDMVIVLYAYPVYLYLNFSGYTDLMISIARFCGVDTLPENFNRPYLARNIQDFWTRWHISFSVWIRHYLFTPLSKTLLRAAPPSTHNVMLGVAVIVTFLVVGAWHGTTTSFLIFGLMHGLAVVATGIYGGILKRILERRTRRAFEAHPLVRAASTFLCFNYVAASFLFIPNTLPALRSAFSAFLAGQGLL